MVLPEMGHNEHRAEKLVVDILACEDVSDARQVGLVSKSLCGYTFGWSLLVALSMPLRLCLFAST